MKEYRYPVSYYLAILGFILFSLVFWYFILGKSSEPTVKVVDSPHAQAGATEPSIGARQESSLLPITADNIIIDESSKRKLVSNLVNIAIKDTSARIDEFIQAFNTSFDTSRYHLRYTDTTLNYLQVTVPDVERTQFKESVKHAIKNMDLLVWDEYLFTRQVSLNNRVEAWYQQEINIDPDRYKNLGAGVTIAVIDNGFDLNHPSLKGKSVVPYNVFYGNADVKPASVNHGSHVASIALGNSTLVKGICENCSLMPIQVEDPNGYTSSSYIIRGILYAIKHKADVINLSLGLALADQENIPLGLQEEFIKNGAKDETDFWKELFAYAKKNNTVCVLAAGNSSMMTGFDPFQRSEFTIKVGALNKDGAVADFSNYGRYTTLFAPGVGILGAKPNNQSEVLDGTSMAAPVVAGYVALLKAKYPKASSTDLYNLLLTNTVLEGNHRILKNKTLN